MSQPSNASPRNGSRSILIGAAVALVAVGALIVFLATRQRPAPAPGEAVDLAQQVEGTQAMAPSDGSPVEPVPDGVATHAAALPQPVPEPAHLIATDEPMPVEFEGPTVLIFGRVTSKATGAPIAGANVALYSMGQMQLMNRPGKALAETQSDADGQYRLKVPAAELNSAERQGLLRAEAENFAGLGTMIMPASVREEKKIDFALGYGGSIAGKVVDPDGAPVAGASVGSIFLENPDFQALLQGLPVIVSGFAESQADGTFTLAGLPEDHALRIPASKEGFLPAISDPTKVGTDDLVLQLRHGEARLHGVLYGGDGAPLEGGMIVLVDQRAMIDGVDVVQSMQRIFHASSGPAGAYRFDALPASNFMLMAFEGEDVTKSKDRLTDTVELKLGDDIERDLHLGQQPVVSGRAIDAESNKGIAGVRISDRPYRQFGGPGMMSGELEDEDREETVTDADGRFTAKVQLAMPGQAMLYYEAPSGWIAESTFGFGFQMVPMESTSPPSDVELRFRRGSVLKGQVLQPDGATPAAQAQLVLYTGAGAMPRTANSKADGTFELTVEPAGSATLETDHPAGYDRRELQFDQVMFDESMAIVLGAYASVGGKVTDRKGAPIAGVAVRSEAVFGNRFPINLGQLSVTTDGTGQYLLERVPNGEVKLIAEPVGSNALTRAEKTVTAESGQHLADVDFVLGEGDFIAGLVVDEDEKPVAGADVIAQVATQVGMPKMLKSDAEGRFTIEGLPEEGRLQVLVVRHPDFQDEFRMNVTVYDGEQKFVLERKPDVELVARDPINEKPITRYDYRLLQEQGGNYIPDFRNPVKRVNDPDGRTMMEKVGAGRWTVEVAEINEQGQPTGRRGMRQFDYAPGREVGTVTVEIVGGRKVTGRVIAEDTGDPVADATVSLPRRTLPTNIFGGQSSNPVFDMDPAVTDGAGRFTLENVPVGSHALNAIKDEMQAKEKVTVVVKADEDPDPVELVLVRRGAIFGKAIGTDGKPLAGAVITHFDQSLPMGGYPGHKITTGEDGAYRIENASAGSHALQFSHEASNLSKNQGVSLKPGEQKEVNFDFSGMIELTGRVAVDDKPWTGEPGFSFSLLNPSPDTPAPSGVEKTGDGAYKVMVVAGSYEVRTFVDGMVLVAALADVAAEPHQQVLDFEFRLVPADILVVGPEGENFRKGRASLAQRLGEAASAFPATAEMNSERRRVRLLEGVEYTGEFNSEDKVWNGTSDPMVATPGGENAIVIFIEKLESIRLGGWDPDTISTEEVTLSYSVPGSLSPGDARIVVDFEGGQHGVNITRVVLKRNGSEIARDEHEGWSGYSDRNNSYTLAVGGQSALTGCTVDVTLRSDGGTMSSGAVFLVRKVK